MKKPFILLIIISSLLGISLAVKWLFHKGHIRFNYPSKKEFPIQGIDVSHHQKNIDWHKIDTSLVQFAFIKATEGGDFKDTKFLYNWEQAKLNGITVGAYHFFTFCKDGHMQAQNFIATVPNDIGMLPPVLDLEYDGNCKTTKTKAQILAEIEICIKSLEKHYQKKVILYVTEDFYEAIIINQFPKNPLWVRDILVQPNLSDKRTWHFWQYSNRGKLDGIETFVDMNVFKGTAKEFHYFAQ